ncbi:autotransporter outer membrane beta-barrel domain-containing protein [Helicobacter cappadocius]|uniref:Autotransporter domain-containing protein n=1 Tax=Helicobacter cappadocius TaxID=3063998 RepID=A0AA90PKU6_9HELI|nr:MULTISPECIES: autotransporter domain-containing protein [unclassified Helicobacter]MDO7253411.1 autotransporter domain-containing protein [Helicobacter sp. faydin-H75]MDP2539325.1 autotransporter domain-containing protein [Helicobacter sp. faydin-H76]
MTENDIKNIKQAVNNDISGFTGEGIGAIGVGIGLTLNSLVKNVYKYTGVDLIQHPEQWSVLQLVLNNSNNNLPQINLQNAISFSPNEAFSKLSQLQENQSQALKNLKDAFSNYTTSLDVSTTQSMINKLQSVTNSLQININTNNDSALASKKQALDKTFSDISSKISALKSNVNDYQVYLNGLQNVLNSIKAVDGSWSGNWQFWINGKKYGFNEINSIGSDLKNDIKAYNGAQGNINGLNDKLNDLTNLISTTNTNASDLANVNLTSGKKQAYQDSLNQIQTLVKQLQNSLKPSDGNPSDELDEARKKYQEINDQLMGYGEIVLALYQMQQTAFNQIHKEQQAISKLTIGVSSNMNKLNFASSLATNSRLAKLSNPHRQDERFAQWIESIKNKPLADNTDITNEISSSSAMVLAANTSNSNTTRTRTDASNESFLSKSIYAYDYLRWNHKNNVWGNIGTILGNSKSVNTASATLSFGYDAWVKNMILGVYGSYAYTSDAIANLDSKNSSHNGDIGFYSRFFLGNNEIDLTLGENIGFNMLSFQDALLQTNLQDNYLSFQTHLDLTYGYVFSLSKGWFSKPFIGVNYNYGYSLGMNAKDQDVSVGFGDFQTNFIAFNAGLEIRKYFNDNESYFYISPGFYEGVLLDNTQQMQTRVYDTTLTQSVSEFDKNSSIEHAFILKVGGEWQASQNMYLNISVGTKLGNLSQYGMLNFGGRYVF